MKNNSVNELELNYMQGYKVSKSNQFYRGCNIESYDFLPNEVPFLIGLKIVNQEANDFSPIEKLLSLRSLSIELTPKPKSLILGKLSNLEHLNIEWFKGAEDLFKCNNLLRLSINYYPKNLGSLPFTKLNNLEYLRLATGGLEEIENFSKLDKLRELELLSLNHLKSINGLESLISLERLRIESCKKIKSIDPIRGLTKLKSLWIDDCGDISSLEPVKRLTNLEWIQFTMSTRITDGNLRFLLDLPKLKNWAFADRNNYNITNKDLKIKPNYKNQN